MTRNRKIRVENKSIKLDYFKHIVLFLQGCLSGTDNLQLRDRAQRQWLSMGVSSVTYPSVPGIPVTSLSESVAQFTVKTIVLLL